jgi:PST family polysaccharide transporter
VERASEVAQRIRPKGGSLRHHTARGTIINSAFQVGLAVLQLLRRVIVAAFLTAEEFGLWGVILVTLFTIMFIKDVGIGDKFVQQSEDDQEVAFQKAFTIDLLLGLLAFLGAAATLPLFAIAYGKTEIIVPGLVLALAIVGNSLQSPAWIYYRKMDFARQRALQSVEPVVGFVLTVALAVAGAGYWCLIIGGVVGAWAGGLVALRICPYRLALRYDRGTTRAYFSFSWPLAAATAGGLVIGQASLLIGTRAVGLAGAGAIVLAGAVAAFSDGIDAIVTRTLYPAICAVRHQADLLFEAFEKSNRLALMWGMPFGLGVALFTPDLVHFVIGDRWESAIIVVQAFGIAAAVDQLGFNWTAFLRALDQTRPLAALAGLQIGAFFVVTAPLLIIYGLPGFAAGWILAAIVTVAGRTYYLARLFSGFRMTRHALRAISPSVPAVGAVVAARALGGGERTGAIAIAEIVLYIVVTITATLIMERRLLREVVGYLRRPRSRQAPAAADAP